MFAMWVMGIACVQAQSSKAIGEAFMWTLRESGVSTDSLQKHLEYKYRKEPAVLAELGTAFYNNQDWDGARSMYDKALAVDPRCADAFIGHGDVFKYRYTHYDVPSEYLDSAYAYYQKAISAESALPKGYLRLIDVLGMKRKSYEKNNTHEDSLRAEETYSESVALLEQLKKNNPLYPSEVEMGSIYMQMGKPKMAAQCWQGVLDYLDEAQYYNFSYCLYELKQYDDAVSAAEAGLEKFPGYPGFYRTIMYSRVQQEDFTGAIDMYGKMSAQTDTLFSRDYLYAGGAYLAQDNIRGAVRLFNRIDDCEDDFKPEARKMYRERIKRIAEGHKAAANYDKAADVYLAYMEEKTKPAGFDMYNWAKCYYDKAKDDFLGDENERMKGVEQCDSAFSLLRSRYPEYEPGAVTFCLADAQRVIDIKEEYKNGRALPYFEQLLNITEGKDDGDSRYFLSNAYHYLAIYWFFVAKDLNKGIAYAQKYKTLNPSDTMFDGMILSKKKGKRK